MYCPRVDRDDAIADHQRFSRPFAFGQTFDAADHDVRPQATIVAAEIADRAICGDEKRQDVEALGTLVSDESRAAAGALLDRRGNGRGIPHVAVDEDLSVLKSGAMQKQLRMRSRRYVSPGSGDDLHQPIACDAVFSDGRLREFLTAHRLHRITPQMGDVHQL